jgi:hypothetical protein
MKKLTRNKFRYTQYYSILYRYFGDDCETWVYGAWHNCDSRRLKDEKPITKAQAKKLEPEAFL